MSYCLIWNCEYYPKNKLRGARNVKKVYDITVILLSKYYRFITEPWWPWMGVLFLIKKFQIGAEWTCEQYPILTENYVFKSEKECGVVIRVNNLQRTERSLGWIIWIIRYLKMISRIMVYLLYSSNCFPCASNNQKDLEWPVGIKQRITKFLTGWHTIIKSWVLFVEKNHKTKKRRIFGSFAQTSS